MTKQHQQEEVPKAPAAPAAAPAASTSLATAPASAPPATLADVLGGNVQGLETGFEDTSSADYQMPFLRLIQKLSPELDAEKPQYRAEAKEGDFLDTSTGELLKEVRIIPCLYKAQMVEWKPDRGGFVTSHDPGIEVNLPRGDKGQILMPSGNILTDTRYWYCLRLTADGQLVPVIISLSSTQIKYSKALLTRLQSLKIERKDKDGKVVGKFTPPMYLSVIKATSVTEEKDKNKWKSWQFDWERYIGEAEAAMFQKAQDARTMFQASSKRMRPPVDEDAAASAKDANSHLG